MKNPWLKFYPSDWRADPSLRMCSLAARGLWIEMLSLMHEGTPYGHLTIKGRPPTVGQIAALVGATVNEAGVLLDELEQAGVFDRKKNGVIVSRRMERDENRARKNRENGKKGGNPKLCKQTEKDKSDNPQDKAQKPEARSQIPPIVPQGDESSFEQFWSSYPHRKNRPSKGKVRPKFERAVKKVPPDRLLAAVERYREHLAGKGSLEFSKGVDAWLNQECWESWLEQDGPKTVEPLDWGMAVKVFREKGSWHSGYGPRPNEDGCRAPSEVLKAHGYTEAA